MPGNLLAALFFQFLRGLNSVMVCTTLLPGATRLYLQTSGRGSLWSSVDPGSYIQVNAKRGFCPSRFQCAPLENAASALTS